jgi:hypothetical protein
MCHVWSLKLASSHPTITYNMTTKKKTPIFEINFLDINYSHDRYVLDVS